MKTIKLEIELEYDDEIMHENDPEGIAWFRNDVLNGTNLVLHDNDIGDAVGRVKVLEIKG